MRLIPAIDILDGKVVRLHQGDYANSVEYSVSPMHQLEKYTLAGAKLVHLVDLDAAKSGQFINRKLFEELIRNSSGDLQVAGGVRDANDIQDRLDLGIKRVVLGSSVVTNTSGFCEWLQHYGSDRMVAAIDVKFSEGRYIPQVHGWTESSNLELFDLLDQLVNSGLKHLLCTDISRDGMMSGPNTSLYQNILDKFPDLIVQASGGVSSFQDLEKLEAMGIPEAISGKALLDGSIDLQTAIERFL